MSTTVKQIVEEYLLKNGFGGLRNDTDCGCFVGDLIPCCGCIEFCEPAFKVPANCAECETQCDGYDEKNEWCLTTVKPDNI